MSSSSFCSCYDKRAAYDSIVYLVNLLRRRNSRDDICELDDHGSRDVSLEELKSNSRLKHCVEDCIVNLLDVLEVSGYSIRGDGHESPVLTMRKMTIVLVVLRAMEETQTKQKTLTNAPHLNFDFLHK